MAILHHFQYHLLFQVSSQNALLQCQLTVNCFLPWGPAATRRSRLQGGEDWPVSRIPGEKGFLVSCLYWFNCHFSFWCFKEKWPCLFSVEEGLAWVGIRQGIHSECWVQRGRFRAEDVTLLSDRCLLLSWPLFTDPSLLLVSWCPQWSSGFR